MRYAWHKDLIYERINADGGSNTDGDKSHYDSDDDDAADNGIDDTES